MVDIYSGKEYTHDGEGMQYHIPITRGLIKKILVDPFVHPWKLHGIGKLQLDLDPNISLHVWHEAGRFENVSTLHTHPWNLYSIIMAGCISSTQYEEHVVTDPEQYTHHWTQINIDNPPLREGTEYFTAIRRAGNTTCQRGDTYSLQSSEIHESSYRNGSVSIVHKDRSFLRRTARIFWPKDEKFGSAEPRLASQNEIWVFADSALAIMEEEEQKK
jgi:hypothetical protein